MAKPSCSTGDSRSSALIPLIGLYVAGATSVCLILMLCDVISSFRRKTRYIPCKLLSINSATLTLLAIASKLPVDLTTYMPSTGDQLSKLTGTTVVCVSICFFMPSLGNNGEAESITNMIALSLFIITIAINICIQIYTGVIFLFIVEHIMVLCCLLMLLTVLWPYTFVVNSEKNELSKTMRNTLNNGEASTSLLHKVRLWYMSSCISNPQYLKRGADYGLSMMMVCFLCVAVVSQAAFRSLVFHKLDLCTGISDYGWSIPIILVSQITTIVVGGLVTAFRWVTMVSDPELHYNVALDVGYEIFVETECLSILYLIKKRKLRLDSMKFLGYLLLKGVIAIVALVTFIVLGAPPYMIRAIFRKLARISCSCCTASLTSSSTNSLVVLEKWKSELRKIFCPTRKFPEWMMRTCIKDMNEWMDLNGKRPPKYLGRLLLKPRRHPPQTLLKRLEQICIAKGYYRLSCLSLVVLVKVIALSMPFAIAEPTMRALDEAFEIIHYIDKKINVGSFEDRRKRQFAKVLLAYKNIHLSKRDSTASNMSVDQAMSSIDNEYQAFPDGYADKEMKIIKDFILDQQYASIEELYEDLEQLFVDMLLFFLPQLPIVILKDVNASPIEVLEERARSALKIMCKLKLLEDKVQWSFPEGITRLMDPEEEEDHHNNDQARYTENQSHLISGGSRRRSQYNASIQCIATPDMVEMSSSV